jgi:pimeloyl-ACP methyl ester carboxylesterase
MTVESTGFAAVAGAQLAYSSAGEGNTVVFVHAGIADRRMWAPQIPAFAARYRVLTYDMRGFGESEMVDEPFSARTDLLGLLDALAVDRAHIVGCSMGGSMALEFAAEHADRIISLVLVNSGAPGFEPEEGYFEPPQYEAAVAALEAGDFERAADLEVEMWVDGPYRSPNQVAPDIRNAIRAMDIIALRSESRRDDFVQRLDPPPGLRLAEIHCPSLVVFGELDMPDMRDSAEYLAAGIGDSQLVEIEGVAHLPNLEKPDVFNEALLAFLSATTT